MALTVKHPALQEEQARLDETMVVIAREIEQLREDIIEVPEDYVKYVVNLKKRKLLADLELAQKKPYFGRIDFIPEDTYEIDRVYIGKRGIVDHRNQQALVIDWRAPIASLYYSGESKNAYYRTPSGIVFGEVALKRNFAIQDGKITGIYDGALKETIHREFSSSDDYLQEGYIDEFLANRLNEQNDARLKDIVATIQSEQNDVIRADMDRPLLVQGVAGSGKTTIALHRLSYLIYNYQDTLSSKRFIVFAPNRLFLNYISEVLPELGVEDVQQSTFADWAYRLLKPQLPNGWRLADPASTLRLFFDGEPNHQQERETTSKRLKTKGSLAWKAVLDRYLNHLMERVIGYRPIRFTYKRTGQSFSVEGDEIRRLFREQFFSQPIRVRLDLIKRHLKQQLSRQVFDHLRERNILLDKEVVQGMEGKLEQLITAYFQKWPPLNCHVLYEQLLSDQELLRTLATDLVPEETLGHMAEDSLERIRNRQWEQEDLASLVYLLFQIDGLPQDKMFDHAVVDEAQDLSPLELFIISQATKRSSVTIVGDMAQGIHEYRGLSNWQEVLDGVFQEKHPQFFTLRQSYRSTVEIMNLANRLWEEEEDSGNFKAIPVLRHGEVPDVHVHESAQTLMEAVMAQVDSYRKKGYSSIAVVTRTIRESKRLYQAWKERIADLTLLQVKNHEYPGGVCIVPSFLTKGLQFDVVILLETDDSWYQWQERKLLYVGLTRPVHRLSIHTLNGLEKTRPLARFARK